MLSRWYVVVITVLSRVKWWSLEEFEPYFASNVVVVSALAGLKSRTD